MKAKILIVDDDPQIRQVLGIALERAGFVVQSAANGADALRMADQYAPALMILDIGLPEMDGLEICRRLRASSDLPLLFLTARDDEVDRILGLELGADDYVTKPFSPRELVARVKAILKRGRLGDGAQGPLRHGVIMLSEQAHICQVQGKAVNLTPSEMRLLGCFMQQPEQVISRAQLGAALYGGNIHVSERTVDSHLRNLKRKLAEAGCADALETLHGVGIRMGQCHGG